MRRKLKDAILDVLTPFSAHGASEVDISTIVDRLQKLDMGIEITDRVVKDNIDPDKIPFVSAIDDTKVYMNGAQKDEPEQMDDEMGEPADPIGDAAKKQASSDMKERPKLKPPL